MAGIIYTLCALAATFCAILLLQSYARSGYRLLLWSGLCFAGLAINNVLLVVDKVVVPTTADLSSWRTAAALLAMCILLYGLVWDTE